MLHAATIFVSAFLLFLVQPVIAREILPWFGGTAAVWTLCMVFFQCVLLAGYAYADRLSRLPMRRQVLVHGVLVLLACASLPIIPNAAWKPMDGADPTWRILALLVTTLGLPYLVVSSTGPLLQSWFAKLHHEQLVPSRVYRLFALSNLASLLALVSYPFLIEPAATLRQQAWAWSAGFIAFSALLLATAWRTLKAPASPENASTPHGVAQDEPTIIRWHDRLLWVALAALATVLLLSVTTHITQDVASVPFLWLLPLVLYLLSFILCFDSHFWYRRWLFWPLLAALVPAMAWALSAERGVMPISKAIPLFSGGLFVVCMFCHGELARARPAPRLLTQYYLMISIGGALGGMFVGVMAPRVFNANWELPGCLALAGVLWAWVNLRSPSHLAAFKRHALWLTALASVCALAVSAATLVFATRYAAFLHEDTVLMQRDFYGVLRVKQTGDEGSETAERRLLNGVIMHGEQYLGDYLKRRPTSYYGPGSGAGIAISLVNSHPQRIGVIGLGAGTVAAYGTPGATVRYYEINPHVVDMAREQFSYLRDSAAKVEIALGDARLSLERELAHEGSQKFDVLIVDAFSSDAIPVHLITREALALYRQHMQPNGVIAFHVTNRYLNLPPVVKQLADDAGMHAVLIADDPSPDRYWLGSTDYVLVTANAAFMDETWIAKRGTSIEVPTGQRLWTDDYNNLFSALKR
jgi:SAM-dependent methyltransferase